jgi:ABC-2 type transport system ATP-binding protein
MSVIVENITKIYGKQKALDAVSFVVEPGQVVGFLGPNGAGKSTMMKIISCFIPQTEGKVTVDGFDVNNEPVEVRRKVGYLPEHNPLYHDMYVKEFLTFIGGIQLPAKSVAARVKEMIEITGLGAEQHKKIGALSKGYRQRVGLAQSMIHNPSVLILDEPTTGLDPNQLVEIRQLIRAIGKEKTVILSTHIMQEVEAICDRVLIINKGKIVADDKTAILQSTAGGNTTVVVEFDKSVDKKMLSAIKGISSVSEIKNNTYKIRSNSDVDIRPALFKYAVDSGLSVVTLQKEENSLESIFREFTAEKTV